MSQLLYKVTEVIDIQILEETLPIHLVVLPKPYIYLVNLLSDEYSKTLPVPIEKGACIY